MIVSRSSASIVGAMACPRPGVQVRLLMPVTGAVPAMTMACPRPGCAGAPVNGNERGGSISGSHVSYILNICEYSPLQELRR